MSRPYKKVCDSQVIISELMLPSRANFNNKIHGGYILSLMDQIAFACASKHSETYCVTASVDTVDFLKPIEIGELVTMKASVNYVGNSSMVVGIRVDAEDIQTGVKKHCNSSYFTMVAKDGKNKNVRVPGLILTSDKEVERFVSGLTRQTMKKQYKSEFNSIDFTSEDLRERLTEFRVKLEMENGSFSI